MAEPIVSDPLSSVRDAQHSSAFTWGPNDLFWDNGKCLSHLDKSTLQSVVNLSPNWVNSFLERIESPGCLHWCKQSTLKCYHQRVVKQHGACGMRQMGFLPLHGWGGGFEKVTSLT